MPRADRARKWAVARLFPGERVVLRNFAVLAPGEELPADDAPQLEVLWDQWLADHATVYGLTVDGKDQTADMQLRQAVARIKTKAQTDQDWAALLRVLRELAANVLDS